jgi:DNA-binding HxlR family transcriptional regulator
MSSEIDDICKSLLKAAADSPKTYAELQRAVGAGSIRTVEEHVKHLVEKGLVADKKVRHGLRFIHQVSLTEKGVEVVKNIR